MTAECNAMVGWLEASYDAIYMTDGARCRRLCAVAVRAEGNAFRAMCVYNVPPLQASKQGPHIVERYQIFRTVEYSKTIKGSGDGALDLQTYTEFKRNYRWGVLEGGQGAVLRCDVPWPAIELRCAVL